MPFFLAHAPRMQQILGSPEVPDRLQGVPQPLQDQQLSQSGQVRQTYPNPEILLQAIPEHRCDRHPAN
jgi:hypothetical protein